MKNITIIILSVIYILTMFTLLIDFAKGAECYRSAYFDINKSVLIISCCTDYHFDPDLGTHVTLKTRVDNPSAELLKLDIDSMCVVVEKVSSSFQ